MLSCSPTLPAYRTGGMRRITSQGKLFEFDDWEPLMNRCHDNVTSWVKHHPAHKEVRGWMLIDLRSPLMPLIGQPQRLELLAHSVVEDESDGGSTSRPHGHRPGMCQVSIRFWLIPEPRTNMRGLLTATT